MATICASKGVGYEHYISLVAYTLSLLKETLSHLAIYIYWSSNTCVGAIWQPEFATCSFVLFRQHAVRRTIMPPPIIPSPSCSRCFRVGKRLVAQIEYLHTCSRTFPISKPQIRCVRWNYSSILDAGLAVVSQLQRTN